MRASMSKKSLIIGIFFFMLLLLAGNAGSETEPIYAGWTVGTSWDDGSGTSYGTILRSTDSGETWTRQGAGQIAGVDMAGVFAVDPYTAWVVGDVDSGYATIYHTTDGGRTWKRKGSSDPASADYVPDVGLCKVHARGDDVWAVGNPGVILHTSDGGATWTNHIPAGYENTLLQGVYTLDGKTVWATGGAGEENNHAVILKSTDAGLNWTRQSGFSQASWEHILGISAADADTAWAVGADTQENGLVLHTTNGDASWTHQYTLPFQDINEVCAVSTSTVWVAADRGIYWTNDGGQSWDSATDLPSGLAYMGICAVSAQKAWASFYQSVLGGWIAYTTDGGTTWKIVDQLNGEDLLGLWTISFATRPFNLDDMIISLIEDVEMLVDDGLLNQGQGNALIVKLEHALDRLADDRLKAAINALEAFSNQVDAFVQGGVLSPEIGQDLSDQVNYIIEIFRFPL